MTPQKEYLSSLTALRGLAALWVMLFHIDVILFYRELGTLIPHEGSGIVTHGYLFVDFFFILSGFVITHVYGDQFSTRLRAEKLKDYGLARFRRIYPLHLFTLGVLVAFALVAPAIYPDIVDDSWRTCLDWSAISDNLLLINAMNQHVFLSWNIVSWSIGAEWWTYFIAPLLIGFLGRGGNARAICIALVAFGALWLLCTYHPKHNLDITYDYGFLRCLFEFAIGTALHRLYRVGAMRRSLAPDHVFLGAAGLLAAVIHWEWPDLLVVPLFAIMVLSAAYNDGRVKRWLARPLPQYLGEISYSIYLVHGVWFMVFWSIMPLVARHYGISTFGPLLTAAYACAFIGLTIATARLTYRFIEVPGRRLFKKPPQKSSAMSIETA